MSTRKYIAPEFSGKLVSEDIGEEHYLNGKLHRVDGPAIIWYNVFKYIWQKPTYFLEGKCLEKEE